MEKLVSQTRRRGCWSLLPCVEVVEAVVAAAAGLVAVGKASVAAVAAAEGALVAASFDCTLLALASTNGQAQVPSDDDVLRHRTRLSGQSSPVFAFPSSAADASVPLVAADSKD